MKFPSEIIVFQTTEELAVAAAERFAEYARKSQQGQGRFSVALAGGKTPRRVYELLATEKFSNRVDWDRVFLFFGDERCVPPVHPDSNYAMAHDALISKVEIPAANVFRLTGESEPEVSAKSYESRLREFFAPRVWPSFDLTLLGMGADGHTASLFPGSDVLDESTRWVVSTKSPQGQCRLTLTLGALNHGLRTIFLITGDEKAATLSEILCGGPGSRRFPASLVKPVDGTVEWFVDGQAASDL